MTENENESLRKQMLLPFEQEPEPDRYEHIELIVKSRQDGTSWFDVIHDYITQDCDSVQIDPDDEDSDWTPCKCGMEHMGGMGGTLQQCYDHSTNLGQGVQPIDVARVIIFLTDPARAPYVSPADRSKILTWAFSEVEFEEYFENREWENEDETGD